MPSAFSAPKGPDGSPGFTPGQAVQIADKYLAAYSSKARCRDELIASLQKKAQGGLLTSLGLEPGNSEIKVHRISCGIPMLLMLTFRQVSADAARATLQVDPGNAVCTQMLCDALPPQ